MLLLLLAALTAKDAEKMLDAMRDEAGKVRKLVEQAKDDKDIVRLDCAREKLALVEGLIKVSEDVQETDEARFRAAAKRVPQIREEAEQCIGQKAQHADEKSKLEVESPTGLPTADPTATSLPPGVVWRPPPASGF